MPQLSRTGKTWLYDGRTGEKFDNPVTVGYKMCIRDRHKIVADVSQPNAFPIEDPELLRALEQRFEEIPAPAYEGFAGLADDLIRAIETDTQPVSSGESGRATLELIAAIYESGATGRTVQLPLSPESPFYRAQGIRDNMPRFHQKRTSVEKLEDAPIILASENMR